MANIGVKHGSILRKDLIDGRIALLCQQEKQRHDKIQKISKIALVVFSPLLVPGKLIYATDQVISRTIERLNNAHSNKIVRVIGNTLGAIYAVPSMALRFVSAPLSGAFNLLREKSTSPFDYLTEGFDKAARLGDTASLEILLKNPKASTRQKLSALRITANHGHNLALELLLDHTSQQDVGREVKADILRCSVRSGNKAIVKRLVDRLEIEPQDCSGAVREAITQESADIGCYLVNLNRTQLTHLVDEVFVLAARQGFTEGVRSLLEPKPPRWVLKAALQAACEKGHLEVVQLLAPKEELRVSDTHEVMIKAAEQGYFEVLKVLIANSDRQRLSNNLKGILLEKMETHGNLDIVKFLIENLNIPQNPIYFNGAIRKALNQEHVAIACYLIEKESQAYQHFMSEVLNQAVDKRYLEGLKALLAKDIPGYYFGPALEKAVLKDDCEIVRMIAPKVGDHRSKINALACAVEKGSLEMVHDLIDSGGLSLLTRRNIAALAQQKGFFEIVQIIQNSITTEEVV